MPENENDSNDEKLLILPLGEESKKITQVITNDTARQIVELLADAPLSASDIAARLQAPLTTITYNLENLERVGLIKVERIKYSEKGREVKIYAPVRRLIVVVPEKTDRKSVADILKKYMGVFLAAVLASTVVEFFIRKRGSEPFQIQAARQASDALVPPMEAPLPAATPSGSLLVNATEKTVEEVAVTPAQDMGEMYSGLNTTPTPAMIPSPESDAAVTPDIFSRIAETAAAHPGILFFFGCLFIITVLALMEYRKSKNRKK